MAGSNAADNLRSVSDRELFDALKAEPAVQSVVDQVEKLQDDNPMGIRRRLLATSVRLSSSMAPDVHAAAAHCIDRLGIEIPVELYVFPSPQFNAMCFKPEDGQLFVMFSSSLLENLEEAELEFVMGHELGHHLYRHHDIPIGYLLQGAARPDPGLALKLFAWSRYAEISADRAGAYCAGDIEAVSRSLFKLASGLTGKIIRFNLQDFLEQVDQMQIEDAEPGQGAPKEDWFSTHPFSPLRVKALQLYDQSELCRDGGISREVLQVGVQSLMSLMEPSYLEGRTDIAEQMRRLLFAGALTVANADGAVTTGEIEVFDNFFGSDTYSESLDLAGLADDLDNRTTQVRDNASTLQAMQVLRDLCVVSRAEGHTSPGERAVLDRIADGLGVSRAFVCHAIDADRELD